MKKRKIKGTRLVFFNIEINSKHITNLNKNIYMYTKSNGHDVFLV